MASPSYKTRAQYKRHIVEAVELNFARPYDPASKTGLMCANIIESVINQGSTPTISASGLAEMTKNLWEDIRLGLLSKIVSSENLPLTDPTLAFVVPGSPDTDPCGV